MPSLQQQITAIEQGLSALRNQQEEFARSQRFLNKTSLDVADRLDSINRNRVETQFYKAPPFDYEIGVPSVTNVEKVAETQDVGVTHLALTWTGQSDIDIDRYEVWAKNVSFQAERPYKVADVKDGPATVQLTSDRDTGVALFIRTIMKNGLSTPIDSAPTVGTNITQTPFGAADIADGSIGDAKLDRTIDPISITSADILNATIQSADIGNAQITNALIANAAISTAKIQNAAITNALIANLAVDDAKINDLAANKILAGTMSAVNVEAGTYELVSSPNTMKINGTDGFLQENTSTGHKVRLLNGAFQGIDGSNINYSVSLITDGVEMSLRNAGLKRIVLASDSVDLGQANSGYLDVRSNTGGSRVTLGVDSNGDGQLDLDGHLSVQEITNTPATPLNSAEVRMYMKDDKLIFQYDDAGTVRYKYLDLTGTTVTWVHTTVAP